MIEAGINQGLVSASFWPVAGASKRPLMNAFARIEGQLWVGSGISGPATIDPLRPIADAGGQVNFFILHSFRVCVGWKTAERFPPVVTQITSLNLQ